MARWFRWMTAVNVVGLIVLVLAMTVPAVFAFLFLPRYSGELVLVPVEAPARPAAAIAATARAPERLEVPPGLRAPDLSPRPWDELPSGGVRLRD